MIRLLQQAPRLIFKPSAWLPPRLIFKTVPPLTLEGKAAASKGDPSTDWYQTVISKTVALRLGAQGGNRKRCGDGVLPWKAQEIKDRDPASTDAERGGWLAIIPITGTQAILHSQVLPPSPQPSGSPHPHTCHRVRCRRPEPSPPAFK